VRELLAIRRREIVPRLAGSSFGEAHAADCGLLTANWHMGDGTTLSLIANLSERDITHAAPQIRGTLVWASALGESMPAWSVRWHIG
jgi:maltooligosyltrehalose trehalohydrolase